MISNILASTRNIVRFSFLRPNAGDNALATIKDLNQVIKSVNTQMFYRPYHMSLTQTAQNDPVKTTLMVGSVADCNSHCSGSADSCGCPDFLNEKNGIISSVTRNGVGVYRINFDPTHPDYINNRGISVMVEPLATPGDIVTIDKSQLAANDYIVIRTAVGVVLTDALLDDTVFHINVYNHTN